MKFLLLLFTLLVIDQVKSADPRIDPLVKIPQGLVRGLRASDGEYSSFLGIPYAQVDLSNPFGAPQPHPDFEEVFNAYDGSIACPQIDEFTQKYTGTLDCLTLNIYVPHEASSQNPLPVLVWIHGGKFSFGYNNMFHPRDLVNKGVIVVTVNYRLGAYGFMCLNTPSVPGNQGVKDQYEALRWIRNNIASFGGNPYEVTLAGQSAGSCSTLLHLFSDKDKLFSKVIAQSGTPLSDGMFVEGDTEAAVKIANHLGFDTNDTDQALDFLTNASPDLTVAAAEDIGLELRPCKEKSFSGIENFVDIDPFSLPNDIRIPNTPILIGHTSKEEIDMLSSDEEEYFTTDPFYDTLKHYFNFNDNELNQVASTIRHFYIGDKTVSREVWPNIEEFVSDFKFYHPVRRIVDNLLSSNTIPIYEYVFSYTEDKEALGAGHSAELKYLFQSNGEEIMNEESRLIANRITSLWSNFVKYGNPTPNTDDNLPVKWEPSAGDKRPYLVIDTDMRLENRIYKERMSFWDLYYSIYEKNHIFSRECLI